jgi:hypothetical protein
MQEKRIVTIQAYRACWAVIISVSEYPSPEVPPATYASNDAFEMVCSLRFPAIIGAETY